jgi:hypothetical protein
MKVDDLGVHALLYSVHHDSLRVGYAAARPPAQATVDAFVAMLTPR